MLFNSPEFVIFLPIVFGLYWGTPHKHRWLMMLMASCIFYMCASVKYILLLAFVIIITYFGALLIEKYEARKKAILIATIILTAGVLFYFKYINFFLNSIISVGRIFDANLSDFTIQIILPVGISFYILQTIAYVVDVYRGEIKAEHHLGYYALFASYFPQLLAGPIGRADQLLPQYKKEQVFNYDTAVYGMKLMMWGFFKKTVIADNLAYRINLVFRDLSAVSGAAILFAIVFAVFRTYCDFSGYSDIARGVSKLFGIDLMENFKTPFLSTSVKELWNRWHISLSSWIRDYIYIPMGGNRKGVRRKNINLIIAFAISGLWHGASWTFVVWGLINAIAQIIETKIKINMPKFMKTVCVFVVFTFAWVFFEAKSMNDAFYILTHMFSGISNPRMFVRYGILGMEFVSVFDFVWHMAVYLIPLFVYDIFSQKTDIIQWTSTLKPVIRHSIYIILIIAICLLHSYGEVSFVYFQF